MYVFDSGVADERLSAARALLRAQQRPDVPTPGASREPVTQEAMSRHLVLTAVKAGEREGTVRRGAFRYWAEREEARVARGTEIIERVDPGPDEDPAYFAMLAHQAASVELAWEVLVSDVSALPTTWLLGTAHSPEVNAMAQRNSHSGYTTVLLDSGLVEFVYQAAKVVIGAIRPTRVEGHPSQVENTTDLEAIGAFLDADPGPVDRLYRTLEANFYQGYPRAASGEVVPEEQHPPLSLLIGLAERWIIAHEYGHGLVLPEMVAARADRGHQGEYYADELGIVATVLSADLFDLVPPEYPLGAAVFALACLDVLRRAQGVAMYGDAAALPAESASHPAPTARASQLINAFRRNFAVEYGEHSYDLRPVFGSGNDSASVHGFTKAHEPRVYFHARVLELAWKRASRRLREDFRNGRRLHPVWTPPVDP